VFQTSRFVHVEEAKHCAFACDVSVLCRCRAAAVTGEWPVRKVVHASQPFVLHALWG
jgi:hypothetical protein